jgi:hypothetical protein
MFVYSLIWLHFAIAAVITSQTQQIIRGWLCKQMQVQKTQKKKMETVHTRPWEFISGSGV